jgi:hypothetical protein
MAWKGTRPPAVTSRDDLVFSYLKEHGPSTRNKIADDLGITRSLTYLSLDRLRRGVAGSPPRVKRCVSQNNSDLLWTAALEESCP